MLERLPDAGVALREDEDVDIAQAHIAALAGTCAFDHGARCRGDVTGEARHVQDGCRLQARVGLGDSVGTPARGRAAAARDDRSEERQAERGPRKPHFRSMFPTFGRGASPKSQVLPDLKLGGQGGRAQCACPRPRKTSGNVWNIRLMSCHSDHFVT